MKVTIEVNLADKAEVEAAIKFLQSNGGAAKKVKEKTPEPEEESEEAEEEDDLTGGEGEITVESLRELTAKKATDDAARKKIREKLEKLGAKNVTSLDKKHFAAYKEFITKLK